ncbi:MAG: 2OG-Fe(II) oxygenase [Alphaproteobacteria bacterium]
MEPRDFIDLARYPIDDLESAAGRDLIAACRRDLDERALCLLSGFVRPDAIAQMAAQAEAAMPAGRTYECLRTPYSFMCNSGFPDDHPRSALFPSRISHLLADQFAADSLIAGLFGWDPLTEFVRQALGHKTLYRSACPSLSVMVSCMDQGGTLGWHFDTNDGVVSLLLQRPDDGGHFEYAPYIRSEEDENYPAVARLFAEAPGGGVRPLMAAGTFVLFKGRRSCHRVSPVGPTTRPRMIALFSYDERPDMVFHESTVRNVREPSSEPYLGQPG